MLDVEKIDLEIREMKEKGLLHVVLPQIKQYYHRKGLSLLTRRQIYERVISLRLLGIILE
jgi:hypothetical protein